MLRTIAVVLVAATATAVILAATATTTAAGALLKLAALLLPAITTTLRALGFQSLPVVISVLAEAVLLSLIGGALGGLAAWLAFDGYQTATMNWQSFSQVAFAFAVTPALLVQALVYATLMGLLGGLLPAWKAARMPVVSALRQL